jgi:hypothetical protein
MNLAINNRTPEKRLACIILHEIGHALGMVHEHQNPANGIPWDRKKVYDYYLTHFKWEPNIVESQVLRRYDRTNTNFSEFDPESIMMYEVPGSVTIDGSSIRGQNYKLSERDKSFIARMYPRDKTTSITIPLLSAEPISSGQTYAITNVRYKNLASIEGTLHEETLVANYEQNVEAEVSRMSFTFASSL